MYKNVHETNCTKLLIEQQVSNLCLFEERNEVHLQTNIKK